MVHIYLEWLAYIHIYILGCFFRPSIFQIPTANSSLEDFGEKITPEKFREKNLTFQLGSFCFEVHEILNKSKISKCSWNPNSFFKTFHIQKLDSNLTPKIWSNKNITFTLGIKKWKIDNMKGYVFILSNFRLYFFF